jgi:hypothetical protein
VADRGMLGNSSQNTTRWGAAGSPQRGMGTYERKKGTKPILSPYVHGETHKDHRDPKLQARLYEESIGFPNLATDPFIREQAVSAVMTGLKDVYNVLEFLRNKWLILYRLYRGETLIQFQYGRAQLHSPEPFKIVETIVPRMMRALFGSERWYKLYGERDQDDESAKMQEMLTRDQFRAMQYKEKAKRHIRDGCIYGTAVQKAWWKQEIGEMTYRDGKRSPDPKRPGATKIDLSEVKRTELVFDGNYVDNVSIFDFYTSPNASDIDDAEWCADRSAWADYKVKQMGEMGHWINLDPLKDHAGTNDMSFGDEFKERKSYAYGIFDPREASWAPHVPHYTVIDWWGPLVVRSQNGSYETKQCNVVMIEPDGPQVIARVTVNPFWHQKKPYVSWRPINLEDEFYGIGPLEPIARLSMEKDMKRNLLMAATQLEANPMWLISDEANVPDGQLVIQPGTGIRVPNLENSIAPLHVPKVSDAALKAEHVLTQDIRETAGTTSPQMGAQSALGGAKTATQHTSEIDEANLRISGLVENYETQIFKPLLHMMCWNNQQFLSYEKVIREVGALGMNYEGRHHIRPEDIIGRFICQPLVLPRLAVKQTQVQQLVNILDRAPVINQMYGPDAVNMPGLLAWILEFAYDIHNTGDFIKLPPSEAGLITASQEHEAWYHGSIPKINPDDNHMRHWYAHNQEFKGERFAYLEKNDPATAAKAVAHAADHGNKLMIDQEQMEQALVKQAQAGAMGQLANGPGGAASPGQDPNSPQIRRNENERSEGVGQAEKSESMQGAPNKGAE